MGVNEIEAMYDRSRVNVNERPFIMSDLSYIASILFTHVKITRQWKSTLSLICRTSSCPGRIRTKTCLGLKMYMTGFFCLFYFCNMSKIWIRNLSSSKIVQNLLQSFVFKTSEFEDCEQSLFRSKICEGSGVCGYSRGEAREPGAASCAGAPLRGQIDKHKST